MDEDKITVSLSTSSEDLTRRKFYLSVFGPLELLPQLGKALAQSPAMCAELEPLLTRILKEAK